MEQKRKEAHEKITSLIEDRYYTKKELSRMLGISYPTVYSRLKLGNWTGKEINIINEL